MLSSIDGWSLECIDYVLPNTRYPFCILLLQKSIFIFFYINVGIPFVTDEFIIFYIVDISLRLFHQN